MLSAIKSELKTCWYCEKPRSAKASADARASCEGCKQFMQQGVICIGVSLSLPQDTIIDKVYRDGNWCVLSRDEYQRRFGAVPMLRFALVESTAWAKAALPKFGKHGASHFSPREDISDEPDAAE